MGNICDCCFSDNSSESEANRSNSFPGKGQRLVNSNQAYDASISQRISTSQEMQRNSAVDKNLVAAATEKRAMNGNGLMSAETSDKMTQHRIKDDLIGSIQHYCRLNGTDEPFGLASCEVDVLRKRLNYEKKKYSER